MYTLSMINSVREAAKKNFFLYIHILQPKNCGAFFLSKSVSGYFKTKKKGKGLSGRTNKKKNFFCGFPYLYMNLKNVILILGIYQVQILLSKYLNLAPTTIIISHTDTLEGSVSKILLGNIKGLLIRFSLIISLNI